MGGGASSFKMSSDSRVLSPSLRPEWLASPMEKVLPLTESKFSLITGIGSGKFGFVYLARHTSHQKCVAIKYISKAFVAENKSVDRIKNEIDIVKRLDHPFVVHCFGHFSTPACIGLVFEYCVGGELFTYMKKQGGGMAEQHAKFYFAEIACALNYLHNTIGIVYRDLKPENIIIDCNGHLKLCDFGFAAPASEGTMLRDGCGTAMYVAPEIASGFSKGSHSFPVDWWGLGCVLAELITGHAPFGDIETTSKFEIFSNITDGSPNLSMRMSGDAKTLVRGLLTKDPPTRWGWAECKSAAFCKDVNWEHVLARSITPPWVPKATPQPSTDNFVRWDNMVLPDKAVDTNTQSYCSVLEIGASGGGCRVSANANGVHSSSFGTPDKLVGKKAASSPVTIPDGGAGANNGGRSTPISRSLSSSPVSGMPLAPSPIGSPALGGVGAKGAKKGPPRRG